MSSSKKQRKRQSKQDLSIVTEVKEPFSFDVFIDEQIVDRWKVIRQVFEERGIIFFLTSPFQYRNRLALTIVLLIFGAFAGVVPRSISLLREAKNREAEQALSHIENRKFSIGSIGLKPLLSSHYEKTHVLAFMVSGNAEDGVTSNADNYVVKLETFSGVIDPQHVYYSYKLVPVDADRRILLVYVDMTTQNDTAGVYTLQVYQKSEKDAFKPQIRVVLSDSQKTSALYDENGIHLSSLSSALIDTSKETPIKDEEDKLERMFETYENRVSELEVNGRDFVNPSPEDVRSQALAALIMPSLKDNSRSQDIIDLDPTIQGMVSFTPSLIIDGHEYTDGASSTVMTPEEVGKEPEKLSVTQSEIQAYVDGNLPDIAAQLNNISSQVSKINSLRLEKYDKLLKIKLALEFDVDISTFTEEVTVK